MGIDYNINLRVGYKVKYKDLKSTFCVIEGASKRREPEYDPRTGKRLPDRVVRDQGYEVWMLGKKRFSEFTPKTYVEFLTQEGDAYVDKEEYEDVYGDFLDALAATVGAKYCREFTMSDIEDVYFGVALKTDNKDAVDDGNITVGGSISVEDICQNVEKLRAIGARLNELGLRAKGPRVFIEYSYS